MGLGNDLGGFLGRAGHDVTGLVLGEEGDMVEGADRRPESLGSECHLDQGGGEAAVGNVMYGGDLARSDEGSDQVAMALLAGQIDGRRAAFLTAERLTQIDRLTQVIAMAA